MKSDKNVIIFHSAPGGHRVCRFRRMKEKIHKSDLLLARAMLRLTYYPGDWANSRHEWLNELIESIDAAQWGHPGWFAECWHSPTFRNSRDTHITHSKVAFAPKVQILLFSSSIQKKSITNIEESISAEMHIVVQHDHIWMNHPSKARRKTLSAEEIEKLQQKERGENRVRENQSFSKRA